MLTNMKDEIKKAKKNKIAIPQFNINNLEWAKFILEECQNNKQPVILGVSEGAIKYMGGYKTVVNIIKGLIEDLNITIPVSIHLDHGSSIESVQQALKAGFTSIMIDSSKENLEENIRITKEVVKLAGNDILVEAEIGPIGTTSNDKKYTKLEDAIELSKTKIDLLAPAIGNKHGIYQDEIKLDFKLLKEIEKNTNLPLVLHGASGIDEKNLKECIKNGITKINFNTELQQAWADEVKKYIQENNNVYDPRKIIKSGEIAIKETIKSKLKILNRQ